MNEDPFSLFRILGGNEFMKKNSLFDSKEEIISSRWLLQETPIESNVSWIDSSITSE